MSNLHNIYPLGHRVYQGGRYLRAFDHASDIDHYEHSILTYLGSLMPFDKKFVDHPAFPSIATIHLATKISKSTVRKRLKSLQSKGYIKIDEVLFLNDRGHFEQSSNNYFLSSRAFQFFDNVLSSREQISSNRKRAVGESFSFPAKHPPAFPGKEECLASEGIPLSMTMPNSLPESPNESQREISSSDSRNRFDIKREVDNIVRTWQELVKIPVTQGEKEKFFREYIRIGGNEIHFMEKLLPIASDPYIAARAKSINFLFSGIDCALKNRSEIIDKATKALNRVETKRDLDSLLAEIPDFIRNKSKNFGNVTDVIVQHLLQEPINAAKRRVGTACGEPVPTNVRELRSRITRMAQGEISEQQARELAIIETALSKLAFGHCLDLYSRYCKKHQVAEAAQ